MVIKRRGDYSLPPEVKWIGRYEPVGPPQLAHRNVSYYKKCLIGALSVIVGDCVLVFNADAAEPDTVAGCDIAKIRHLYEVHEMSEREPYRAVVQWFSRPSDIPHRLFDNDDISINFDYEVIEDHRPYGPTISLDTIFRKCMIINGTVANSAIELLNPSKLRTTGVPMFVCRYRFVRVKQTYKLIPLESIDEPTTVALQSENTRNLRRRSYTPNMYTISPPVSSKETRRWTNNDGHKQLSDGRLGSGMKRRSSLGAPNAIEFISVTDMTANESKVSPIKIIGGKSVVRLSSAKKERTTAIQPPISPLTEKNYNSNATGATGNAISARRNLNQSMENAASPHDDSDIRNYSIIKGTPDPLEPDNDMKIKLRVSQRRCSAARIGLDDDPLSLSSKADEIDIGRYQRKRFAASDDAIPHHNDIYMTPSKISKESTTTKTPARRKSILKSGGLKLTDGTPRRSIQLSDVVERKIYKDDDVICTPRSRNARRTVQYDPTYYGVDGDDCAMTAKTPTKARSARNAKQADDAAVTPRQKPRSLRRNEMSPAIGERRTPARLIYKSDLQSIRESLHVSVVPQSLPCREVEFNNIYAFVEGKIQDECGGCMYVSGVPGTGKTATVTGVIRKLKEEVANDVLPDFEYIEINGMRLTEPRQAYVQIYKQLTGKTLSWEHAHSLLEKRFATSAPRRVTTVLLVDELDVLCNRRQDVVYNLLDWPSKSSAQLVVVAIANTMDLPERLLMGKVTSRLGLTRLTFQPYSHKQLQEIVAARLSGFESFKSDAIQLVARKVAAVSGDARRALDICRRAAEIADSDGGKGADNNGRPCVTMTHVQKALQEMISSVKVQAVKNCSRLEQIFLQAIESEVTRTGVEETTFMGTYTQMEIMATFLGVAVPSIGRTLRICSKLGSERLIICEHSRNDIFQKILLNVSTDDIHYALKMNNS